MYYAHSLYKKINMYVILLSNEMKLAFIKYIWNSNSKTIV